jgi:succinoglycan biosynthesis transport protein ExoP
VLNMALALFVGLALAGATVFAREQIFTRIISPDDVNERLGLPVLGTIPLWREDGNVIDQLSDPKSEVSEAYNSVRSSISLASGKGIPKTLAFVSTQAREGKSSTCMATALSMSRLNKKCVVVDLDFRRPNVHKLLGMQNDAGASNVLAGETTAAAVIRPTAFPNLSAITGGPIAPNPTELLTDDRISALFDELAQSFEVIFVDSPPVLSLADALVVSNVCEATIFVAEAGRNSPSSAMRAIGRLRDSNSRILGVVLTRFNARRMGYGYDQAYSYRYE